MKRLTTLITLILLILSAGVFAAENLPTTTQPPVPHKVQMPLPHPGFSVLKLDPMELEIADILQKMQKHEDKLLAELLAATDEKQAEMIIRRIEFLDTDRELALLKVQARYARLDGRFDLEREIKGKILDILSYDLTLLN